MRNLSTKAGKFVRARFNSSDGSDADGVAKRADSARDTGRWEEAAGLYRQAFAETPTYPDYLIQAGNCFKEAGLFSKALRAYSERLSISQSADGEVMLGHLMKISGNFGAARRAYLNASALGDARAESELQGLREIDASTLRIASERHGNRDALPIATFFAVAACEIEGDDSADLIRRAAAVLAASGERDLAKSFYEAAFLVDNRIDGTAEHLHVVLHSGLWPVNHLAEISLIEAKRRSAPQSSPSARLRRLLVAAASLKQPVPAEASPPTQFTSASWPPQELPGPASEALLLRLSRALGSVYEAIATTVTADERLIAGLSALSKEALAPRSHAVFISGASANDLRHFATLVLNDIIALWLMRVAPRFLGHHVETELVSHFFSSYENPLLQRLIELGSSSAVFNEIDMIMNIALETHTLEARDRALARVFVVCAPEMTGQAANDFLEEALSRHLLETSVVLCEHCYDLSSANQKEIVVVAQKLKMAGGPRFAFDLLNRWINEELASVDCLIEKALVAKILGEFSEAARLFEKCAHLSADNIFVRRELVAILPEVEPIARSLERFRDDPLFMTAARERKPFRLALGEDPTDEMVVDGQYRISDLAPEIATELGSYRRELHEQEEIAILEAGWLRRTGLWGKLISLRQVDFVRVRVTSREKIFRLRVRIDGRTVGSSEGILLRTGYERAYLNHYIFNCWFDLSGVRTGLHEMQLYFEDFSGGYRTREELVFIDAAPPREEFLRSASTVSLPDVAGKTSIDERISNLPSVAFEAKRSIFEGELKKILVVRADQLGDTSQSISAMLMLKDAFPEATFECLTSPGNMDLLRSIDIFDEVHGIELTYNAVSRRRSASFAEQLRIQKLLEPRRFDLAVDLSPGFETQNLLLLSKARHTAGFKPNHFNWLTFGAEVQTHDPVNKREMMPHSAQIEAFVASLVAMAKHTPLRLNRREGAASWDCLAGYGIQPHEHFAVLHSGARLLIKRWPLDHYVELSRLIIRRTALKVVLLVDDETEATKIDVEGIPEDRLCVATQKVPFETFDALLALSSVFVGNDTGPKHLAALRGVPVVSVHMGQVNWSEWGQDSGGLIIARRVPCVGCGIELPEECGKGLPCLVDITPEEVYDGVEKVMAAAQRTE